MSIYHRCGAFRVRDSAGDGRTGLYNRDGSLRISIDDGGTGRYTRSGALRVSTGIVRPFSGAQPVTFVDGTDYVGANADDYSWNVITTANEIASMSGVFLWTADSGLTGNPGVSAWADLSGTYTLVQATAANQPQYEATGWNGYPCLDFDSATTDFLELTTPSPALPVLDAPGEIFALVQQDALVADTTARVAVAYGGGSTVDRRLGRVVVTGNNRFRASGGNGVTNLTATANATSFGSRHVLHGLFGGAIPVKARLDAVAAINSVAGTLATVNTTLRFGRDAGGGSNYWDGKIRDVVITNRSLTAAETTAINDYLMSRRAL
jgi:hypothetical protein